MEKYRQGNLILSLDEEDKVVSFKLSDLGLGDGAYILTDVWAGEKTEVTSEYTVTLAPHDSRLISVNLANYASVLDADVKLECVKGSSKAITFTVPYAKEGKVEFNKSIKSVEVVGNGSYEIDGKVLKVNNVLATYKVKF